MPSVWAIFDNCSFPWMLTAVNARFATEIAGRRAYANPAASSTSSMIGSAVKESSEWDGLGEEMRRAGWFD